jgi:hypothetical protein
MILTSEMMPLILHWVPTFRPSWQAHLAYWGGKPAGLCNDMQAFSTYIIQELQQSPTLEMPLVFDLMEHLLIHGEKSVQDVVATCFLENLLNSASSGELDVMAFAPYVGEESRKYCQAWDDFTGYAW